MSKTDRWFTYMREDINQAQSNLEAGNNNAVHYFLGRLNGDIRVLREIMKQNPGKERSSKK